MSGNVWFTSDTHFHHANVIKYCSRPFKHVAEMNAELTRRWNARVRPEDTVYHLGDFAMGPRALLAPTRACLNGKIILIRGNHDRSAAAMREAGFDEVYESMHVKIDDCVLVMRHHPPAPEDRIWCDYRLCGHVHEAWARKGKVINVGVDVSEFWPLSLDELLSRDGVP